MVNGKKIAFDVVMGARIVDLRQSGLKWKQIDELLFPGLVHKDTRCGSFAGDFCQKHRKDHPELDGAFSKMLIGGFSPVQEVISLRPSIVPMGYKKAAPVPQVVEMFI